MRFLDPTNDITFRKIFGDEQHQAALVSFINAVLGLKAERAVVSVTIANPYQVPKLESLKETIVDVRATDGRGREFVVEMQCRGGATWMKRAVYGVCKAMVGQLDRGDEYELIKPVHFIGVLRFKMPWEEIADAAVGVVEQMPDTERAWLTHHVLMDQITHEQSSYDLSMHLLELPRFDRPLDQCLTIVEKWAWFFKHAKELTEVPAEIEDTGIKEAFATSARMGWTEEELNNYENAAHYQALAKAELQAVALKCREEGREEGLEKGREEGRLAEAKRMVMALHQRGMSAVELAAIARVEPEQVKQWLSTAVV